MNAFGKVELLIFMITYERENGKILVHSDSFNIHSASIVRRRTPRLINNNKLPKVSRLKCLKT